MLYTITPYYKIICRQKSNFFRIPETVETSQNWVIEEVEKELVEDPASLESSSGTSGEPVISTSESGNILEQIRKKLREERQQQVTMAIRISLQ